MSTFTELRQLADDLDELGDTATAVLVRKEVDRFSASKLDDGKRILERVLRKCRRQAIWAARARVIGRLAAVIVTLLVVLSAAGYGIVVSGIAEPHDSNDCVKECVRAWR